MILEFFSKVLKYYGYFSKLKNGDIDSKLFL